MTTVLAHRKLPWKKMVTGTLDLTDQETPCQGEHIVGKGGDQVLTYGTNAAGKRHGLGLCSSEQLWSVLGQQHTTWKWSLNIWYFFSHLVFLTSLWASGWVWKERVWWASSAFPPQPDSLSSETFWENKPLKFYVCFQQRWSITQISGNVSNLVEKWIITDTPPLSSHASFSHSWWECEIMQLLWKTVRQLFK